MTNRERAIQLINQVPEYKLGHVIAYIQGLIAVETMERDDALTPDDIRDIAKAREEYANGETVSIDDIDWE